MKQTVKIMLVSALAAAAVVKAVPALAEPGSGDVNVTIVRTADLDLTSKAGQRALERRLAVAAAQVCGSASDADLSGRNQERTCVRAVLTDARARSADLVAERNSGGIEVAAR